MWRGRKGSGGREVFKAACGRREAAGGCGFGGWVERGGWGGRGACEAGKRRTWRRPRRSCPVEEQGQRGALGPRCSRRPAKAVRLGAGAAATTHGLSTRVAGSRVPEPRKKGPWALMCKSSDGRQAGGQRPSVRSQGRGTALGTRAQTDGLYRPGLASPVDRHQSSAPSSYHLDGERCATSRASRASLHSSYRTSLSKTPTISTNHAPARGFLKATQQLNHRLTGFVWELLASERPNADVCKKAHAASDALPGFWSGL